MTANALGHNTPSTIQRIEPDSPLPDRLRGGVVAIGNFDGIHRGHISVLEKALDHARANGNPALALTFEPHPRTVFRPDKPVFRLTDAAMKARLLGHLGFDAVVEQPFTRALSQTSADEFVDRVMRDYLGACHVVTGFDFHFGKDREGGPAFLMRAGETRGFDVTLVDAFRDENADVISSSRIRALLAEGDVAQAAGQLGYRFTVEAEVTRGKQLGRTLGYPTANMALSADCGLKPGIYAVRLRRADGTMHNGVASFGRRPTVEDDGGLLLETFVFDFNDNLYGENCSVSFFAYLRGEEKFEGLDALKIQMDRDAQEARAVLAGARPIGPLDEALCF